MEGKSIKTEIIILANLKKIKCKDTENINILMGLSIMDNSNMDNLMEKVKLFIKMVIFMMETGKMIKRKVLENTLIQMMVIMKENL